MADPQHSPSYSSPRSSPAHATPSPSSSPARVASPTPSSPIPAAASPVRVDSTEQQRERLGIILSAPDAIMDVNAPKNIKDYMSFGGQPQTVVKSLSESYKGYAQMCNLMGNWLKASGMDDAGVNGLVEDNIKGIITEVFDPKKADTIFSEQQSAPQWLEFMITEPNWRSLLYQLSEAHNNCLMLNFAIQRISDLGLQGEIASLSTASTFLSVFNRVLQDTLTQICTLDQQSISGALTDLKKMCCHSQHTYLYAQGVIHNLMQTDNGYHLKRLSEELESYLQERSTVIRRINFLLSDVFTYPVVAQSLSAMLTTGSTNPGDIIKLFTEYSKPEPPPVELLRHPDIFELLIKDLFNPAKTINPTHKAKYFYVLAYAASIQDPTPTTTTQTTETTETIKETITEHKQKNKQSLEATIEALETVQPICLRNSFGQELQLTIPTLKAKLVFPVVAMGLLYWIRTNFLDPSYYTTSYNTLCTPLHLDILREICAKHPLQRHAVLDILVKSFEMEPELEALAALDLKRTLMDNIIFVMRCGYVLPIMQVIENWLTKIDQSLIRYFVIQVLDMTAAPYSQAFVMSLLRVMAGTTEALKSLDSRDLVRDFIVHCANAGRTYTWSEGEKGVLVRLAEAFVVPISIF